MEREQQTDDAVAPSMETNDETSNGGKAVDNKECIPPLDTSKLPDNNHGNRFQSKLLLLCFIRAINKNYENFYLGTELDKFGGKFDDLIFIRNDDSAKSFLYLQAKHGLHEKPHSKTKSITTAELLNKDKDKDFDLPKYLNSYFDDILKAPKGPKPKDQVDLVICTNFGFDDEDLKKNGIELEAVDQKNLSPLVSDLLTFDTEIKWFKFLANVLYGCAKEKKPLDKQAMSFKSYLPILLKENVIASSPNIKGASIKNYVFHPDFLEDSQDNKRSKIAKELRKTLIALELEKKDEWKTSWKTWQFITVIDILSINSVDEESTRKTMLPTCYRFKSIPWLSLVANVLRDCATSTAPTGKEALDSTKDAGSPFQKYLAALLKENVIDTKPVKEPVKDEEGNIKEPPEYRFHADFIGDSEDARSEGVKELRKIILRFADKDKVEDQDKEKDNWKNWTFVINEIAPFIKINEFDGIKHRKLVFTTKKGGTDGKSGNVPKDIALQDIVTFFDRLFLIAINTPNENELDDILKCEVANQLKLLDTDLQLNHISKEFADWFKEDTNKWLSANEGWNISFQKMKNKFAPIHAVVLSTRNQKLLNQKCCEFNGQKINAMVQNLNEFFDKNLYRILHITTPAPELSAIKLIAALKHDSFSRKKYFIFHDRLLWTTPRGWREFEKDCMMTMMKEDEADQLLVVVCNDDDTVQVVIGGSSTDDNIVCLFNLGEWESIKKTKHIIVITKPQIKIDIVKGSESILLKDTIEFDQLSQEFVGITERKPEQRSNSDDAADGSSEKPTKFKTTLMDAKILFQGKTSSIRELIPLGDLKNVFQSDCLTAFLTENENKGIVTIPSFDTSSHIEKFQESLYIPRRINEPFNDEQFREQLAKELGCSVEQCDDGKGSKIYHQFGSDLRVHENGKFRWLNVENDGKKKEIWEKMNTILENKYSSAESSASPNQKLEVDGFAYDCISSKGSIIISSFAGTGKSSFLSRCYRLIKSKHPDWWVIKINLADHSEALRKINNGTFNPSTTGIDFLTSLPDVVGSEQSPFVRSLLKHRLLAGDRIVLMLDGFDEIDDKCREAVIKLIKVPTAIKTAWLVTTRPHVANDLQYQLSQLAYTLDNFNAKDQIECVTKFWKDKLLKEQQGDEHEDKVNKLKTYAESLIRQVTKSIEYEHRAFIGIPLQCRIVAECFLKEAERKITQTEDDINQQKHQEEQMQDLNLAKLYELLMKTKRKVFLREKMKLTVNIGETNTDENSDEARKLFLEETLKNIQAHLLKLAIETIVSKKEYVELLLPPRPFVCQSDENRQKKQERLDKLSVSYGLTNINGQGKIEFLHRTYAEYLFADYLYYSFVLDEEDYNKLLEMEKTREFVLKDVIFKCSEYFGTLVFLDFKLKRLLESQEWLCLTSQRSQRKTVLPNRYYQIANFCVREQKVFFDKFFYLLKKYSNISTLVWNCLDLTFHKNKVREVLKRSLKHRYFELNPNVLKRFLQYYDDANYPQFQDIVQLISEGWHDFHFWDMLRPITKETIAIVFDYLKNHCKFLDRWLHSIEYIQSNLLDMFWDIAMFEENICQNDLDTCFDLLITHGDVSSKELLLDRFFLFSQKRYRFDVSWEKRMEKMLDELRKHKRQKTLEVIIKICLMRNPDLFQRIYEREQPPNFALTSDIPTLLSRDDWGMTPLHQATFYNKKEVVKHILTTFSNNLNDEQVRKCTFGFLSHKWTLLDFYNCSYVNPLFIAALRGNEEIGCQLVVYFEKHGDAVITDSLMHAARGNQMRVYEFLLKLIKQSSGYAKLLEICRHLFYVHNLLMKGEVLESSLNVIFQDDTSVESFTFLSELFLSCSEFRYGYEMQTVVENVRGMLQKVGEPWIHRFLESEAKSGFHLLTRYFRLGVLDDNYQQQFMNAIITLLMTTDSKGGKSLKDNCYNKLLNWIVLVYADKGLKDFLLHELEGSVGVFIVYILLKPGGIDFAFRAIDRFTDAEMKQQVLSCLMEKGPIFIKEELFSQQHQKDSNNLKETIQILKFYLEYASDDHLSTFVNDLTAIRKFDGESLFGIAVAGADVNEIEEFTQLLLKRLNDEAIKMLVLHKDQNDSQNDDIIFARNYFETDNKSKVTAMLSHMPEKKRNEIQYELLAAVSASNRQIDQIEKRLAQNENQVTEWGEQYLLRLDSRVAPDLLYGFNVFAFYLIEKFDAARMRQFVQFITVMKRLGSVTGNTGRACSIWSDYVDKVSDDVVDDADAEHSLRSCHAIEKFLQCVKEKLSSEVVLNELLFHDDGGGRVIDRAGQSGNLAIVNKMLSQLDAEKRSEIIRDTFEKLNVIEGVLKRYGPYPALPITRHLLGIGNRRIATNLVDPFDLLTLYFFPEFNDNDLREFFQFVLQEKKYGSNYISSIWSDYIKDILYNNKTISGELKWRRDGGQCWFVIGDIFNYASKLNCEDLKKKLIDHTVKGFLSSPPDESWPRTETIMENFSLFLLRDLVTNKESEQDHLIRRYTWQKLGQYSLNYDFVRSLDRIELSEFVEDILTIYGDQETGSRYSVWDEHVASQLSGKVDEYDGRRIVFDFKGILLFVTEKLGKGEELKGLLNHDASGNGGPAILRHTKKWSSIISQNKDYQSQYRQWAQYLTNDTDRDEYLKLLSPPDVSEPLCQ